MSKICNYAPRNMKIDVKNKKMVPFEIKEIE